MKRWARALRAGDETAIGHFLALQQLAGKDARITGLVALAEPHHREEFDRYFPGWEVKPVQKRDAQDYRALGRWIEGLPVAGLRKLPRQKGYAREQVRAQGFWG
jgi:hypothetical protein